MASATGIPEQNPREEEPLLGRPGDATQLPEQGLQFNFITGTAILAQAGAWILAALVWAAVFQNEVIFFSYHPLLQSAGILLLVEAILVVQPTASQKQKRDGTWVHSGLNFFGVGALVAGIVVIEMNKAGHPHYTSAHGRMGLVTFILIGVQFIVGFVQYWVPQLVLGSVDNGKSLYKYHRISGYLIVILSLATVAAATFTGFNENVLKIKLWAVIISAVLVLIGLAPRIKKHKLGL